MRLAVAAVVLALASRSAMAAPEPPRSEAMVILDRAISAEKQPKELEKALAELDAILAKNPKDADAHYVRGWILSRSGSNNNAAVAAYDKAFELDPRLADAAYNAGVVLGRSGNAKDAIVRFERALKINAKHVDAAYNAGQSYYDLGEFALAAARWETAAKLSPDDFQIAKKLVQAYVALGRADKVKKARDRVFAMRKADPEVGKLKSYVYDQFVAGKYHVYVYETFDTSGEGTYVYQAKVALKDKVVGSVTLETSKGGFALGIDKAGEHALVPEHTWKKQPDYAAWKALVGKTIEAKF
jgi:tetratricopeptide (TPR) repeat protein